MAQNSVEGGWR